MEAILGFFDRIWTAYKARRAAQAAADLQRGVDVITMAQGEADLMARTQKALDDQLSSVPVVPAVPVPPPAPKP